MKAKRLNPYQRLLGEIQDWMRTYRHRRQVRMLVYPQPNETKAWTLARLYERTAAADQLGYEVILEAKDGDLVVVYRKVVAPGPWW